ncbi:transketolase [Acetobacter nitrogenifigens DSM 23921 = NBRC 105050]|uniref:Transketolase n=1 Tax=Acetobacter nitrogenifigens DSM 23921 = NBRC 105050 TaxID=1120919 RepID=A0A511XDP1_9PROT|nr:transketolase [Acetobacter nitrogenifigens]GBQ96914.1 transketolase [Acetobacter nitrogenifigens DSM 23921 = NBRC 105050]GEN61083.1 transketolase [Acetobacter nitrogenifigens DSM 23921 = NBRC 105050]
MRSIHVQQNRAPEAGGAPARDIDRTCIDTIRTLSMDAVQKANSGHPGTAMALAPVAYTLWQDALSYDPADPLWPARDRFVLSVGHASMLLYSLIHLSGIRDVVGGKVVDAPSLTIDDLKQFRQIGSKTPGHPEYHHTAGVETTTGPLGQGCANSVGMAIAQKWLAARFDKPGFPLFDYHVYTLCGDGDMMEGVASEAASTAGHLKLGNLTWIYDSNRISIEGSTDIAFTEDVAKRFDAYGWQVLVLKDANDTAGFLKLLEQAKAETTRPTFILVHSVIAWGAPKKAGTAAAHGEPLGADEIKATKAFYGASEQDFFVPDGVLKHFQDGLGARGAAASKKWKALFAEYKKTYPGEAAEIELILERKLPEGWDSEIPTYKTDAKGVASRQSSGEVLNAVAAKLPWLIGGAADLAPSTKTLIKDGGAFQPTEWNGSYAGRNLHFGVREHAMGAIVNGIALSGVRPYGAGFLIFSDYMKPPIRLASLMGLPSIFVFTHDSIGVGEDGPTHQPIEQLVQLRATPGVIVLRPGDANEVAEAWRTLIPLTNRPAVLALSRQNLPTLDREKYAPASGVQKGAYVLADSGKTPAVILIATGSELQLAVEAYEKLIADGVAARVVSMPSWELFEEQPQSYRDEVLPPAVKGRVAIEAASPIGWHRYVGEAGTFIGMNGFGASAPLPDLLKKFGFTVDAVIAAARKQAGL